MPPCERVGHGPVPDVRRRRRGRRRGRWAVARLLSHHDLRWCSSRPGPTSAPAPARPTRPSSTPASMPRPAPSNHAGRAGLRPAAGLRPRGGDRGRGGGRRARRLGRRAGRRSRDLAGQGRGQRLRRPRIVDPATVYDLEPNLGPGARRGLLVPDEHIIDPWSTPLAFATRRRQRRRAARSSRGHWRGARRRRPRSCGRPTDGCAPVPGQRRRAAGDDLHRALGHDTFTIRPRRGELIVFDKLARPLLGRTVLPVPTAHQGGARRPDGVRQRDAGADGRRHRGQAATGCTREGIDRLLAQGRRILPALVEEEVTAVYAGLRAATEHQDYVIELHLEQRYVCLGGIRSTGLTASMAIAEEAFHGWPTPGCSAAEGRRPADRRAMLTLGEPAARPYQAGGPIVCHCERVTPRRRSSACAGPDRGGRPGRRAAPDASVDRSLPGLLLHGGRARPGVRRPGPDGGPAGGVGAVIDVLVVGGGPAGLSAATPAAPRAARSSWSSGSGRLAAIPRHTDHTGFGARDLHRLLAGPAYARALVAAAKRPASSCAPGTSRWAGSTTSLWRWRRRTARAPG